MSGSDPPAGTTGADGQGAAPETGSAPQDASRGNSDAPETFDREYVERLRRENAAYRTERNGLRDEVATLRGRADAHDRSRVEQIAASRLHDPRDLLDRLDLADVRGEDGSMDETAIGQRIDALLAERPHLGKPSKPKDWGQGARGTRGDSGPADFGSALKNHVTGRR